MDFFKFTADPSTDLSKGVYFGGWESAMWVERYRQPGSFEFQAPLSSGLREILPLGTVISHTRTLEAAMVENHSIIEAKDSDPTIKISGRSLDAFLENRIVGLELAWNDPNEPYVVYSLASATAAQQAKKLINDHIQVASVNDADNSLNDDILAEAIVGSDTPEARELKRESLHKALLEILNVDDLGLKVVRKNDFGVWGVDTHTQFYIHKGVDRSNTVSFDWDQLELDTAEYLFSNKNYKNTALVSGRFMEEIVYPSSASGIERRVMYVDGTSIDEQYSDLAQPWSGAIRTEVRNKLRVLGQQALAAQKLVDIASVDISSLNPYEYRTDYDIGDIVSIAGNYDTTVKRRVVEHVEIEDKKGAKSYPTLAALE